MQVMIQIPDEAYVTARERACQEGYGSPEIFLSDYIVNGFALDTGNLDHLFTPEVIAAIDRGAQQCRDGKSISIEEVEANFPAKRAKWLANLTH